MKFLLVVALLAGSLCSAAGFEVNAPPQPIALSPYAESREIARQQLFDAVALMQQSAEKDANGLTSVGGLTAPASASIATRFFNHVLSDLDAYINKIGTSIVIPGVSESHYNFADIHFSKFSIGAITVTTSAPNMFVVNINNVGITVPETHFQVKANKLIHCAGKFSVDVEGGNFAITLAMGNDGAGHITTVASVATSYSKLQVHHKFDHALCKIANSIINALVGNIDKLIDKVIKTDVPKALGPAMTKSFDAMFAKIPLHFTGTPTIVNQGLSVTVDLLASTANFPKAVPYTQRLQQLKDFSHDITLDVPATSINNIMTVAQSAGKFHYDLRLKQTTDYFKALIPAAYNACPDCVLDVVVSVNKAPFVMFAANDIDVSANQMVFAINGVNTAGAIVPLFAINVNSTLDVDNVTVRVQANSINNLYFQLNVQTLSITLGASSVGPLPLIDVVGSLLSGLVKSFIIPAFNSAFTGFDFPALFGGVSVTALVGVFQFETNILLPPIQ